MVNSGYQPDTKSASARRADFELLRRNGALQQRVDDLQAQLDSATSGDATSHWNSAWGIVCIIPPRTEVAEPLSIGVGGAYLTSDTVAPFATIIGRRYRVVAAIRSMSPASVSFYFSWTNGWNVNSPIPGLTNAYWTYPVPAGSWGGGTFEWLIDGDGVTRLHSLLANIQAGSAGVYHATSKYYIEDIGPVSGAPIAPDPTPPWIRMTLLNGWRNETVNMVPASYRKIDDMVYLQGTVELITATSPINIVVGNLPVGYRPPLMTRFSTGAHRVGIGGMSHVRMHLQPGGNLVVDDVSPAMVDPCLYLNGISYSLTPLPPAATLLPAEPPTAEPR